MNIENAPIESRSRSLTSEVLRTFLGIGLTLLLLWLLNILYSYAATMTDVAWQGIAGLNTILAGFVVIICLGNKPQLMALTTPSKTYLSSRMYKKQYLAYIPGCAVLVGSLVLSLMTRNLFPNTGGSMNFAPTPLPWIFLIPIIEEILFRVGFGSVFALFLPPFAAIWLNSCLFAMAHSQTSLANILAGHLSLPMGPFLLGLCCGLLIRQFGTVWSAVFLHASCNSSVIIFQWLDPRWLTWLSQLYL